MKVFFTADLHFGHNNIIKHCKRPFQSVDDMDDALIDNWNAVVSNKDTVYICGDVGMCKPDKLLRILWRLNGAKHLVFRLLQKRVIALSGTARSFREPMENFIVAAARNGTYALH